MRKLKWILPAMMALGMLGQASPAEAGLLGHSIDATYYYPDLSTVYEDDGVQTVNPSATWVAFREVQAVATDTQIVITNVAGYDYSFTPASFNGYVFTDQGGNLGITSVTVDAATNVPFTIADVTLTTSQLELNWQGIDFPQGSNITLDLSFASVPEPSSLVLASLGTMGVIGYGIRRRRHA